MKNFIFALTLLLSFCSCSSEDSELSKEEEVLMLQEKFSQIEILSESKNCENSDNWTFTAYGSKACGGPKGFIAYSIEIDTVHFLQLIEQYTEAEDEFNKKWGIISDCSVPLQPLSIVCKNGEPTFEY